MKNAETALLGIPGVTEAQVFAKVLVRCEFPMSDETMMELQCAQARIEYETGWKVEMTISAGKCCFGMGTEPVPMMDNDLGAELDATQIAQVEAEEREVEEYARLLERDPKERARHREFCRGMNMLIFGDNGPKPQEEGE